MPPEEGEPLEGEWLAEVYAGRVLTLVPLDESGPLTPEADERLRRQYGEWCQSRGGGDCLGLLEDGPFLRTDDRRTLALALALGPVLDETRQALEHELLNTRFLVSMVVWTVALYSMMWLVPEPTTKALAAALTVMVVGWLGVDTVWGLMNAWAELATTAHAATTFEELREAGARYARVLGADAARAMILVVASLTGRLVGEVAALVKSLPGYGQAAARWWAQAGGAAALEEAEEASVATEGALACGRDAWRGALGHREPPPSRG